MTVTTEAQVVRDLAKRYLEICNTPEQQELRRLWRAHNSLKPTRPLVLCMPGDAYYEIADTQLVCEDPLFRTQEFIIKRWLYQATLGDDTIFEPWIDEWAVYVKPLDRWGVPIQHHQSDMKGGAWQFDPPLKELSDIEKLVRPHHEIDEAATAEKMVRLRDAVGDVIEVKSVRAPYYRSFRGDISTDLAHLRGLEQVMEDMYDNPEWLHRLLAFMSGALLEMLTAGEEQGDWRLADSNNQAMPYAEELDDPGAHDNPVTCRQLWGYMASQELTLVSPAMFEEFMFEYQLPLLEKFGLVAYGCCEDLTRKIDVLRRCKNLRRIAVTPFADLRACAEQIGTDYVISWRPNPSIMVCNGWDPQRVREVIRDGLQICKGQHMDITLKDVQTVEQDPARLPAWVKIVKEEIANQ